MHDAAFSRYAALAGMRLWPVCGFSRYAAMAGCALAGSRLWVGTFITCVSRPVCDFCHTTRASWHAYVRAAEFAAAGARGTGGAGAVGAVLRFGLSRGGEWRRLRTLAGVRCVDQGCVPDRRNSMFSAVAEGNPRPAGALPARPALRVCPRREVCDRQRLAGLKSRAIRYDIFEQLRRFRQRDP